MGLWGGWVAVKGSLSAYAKHRKAAELIGGSLEAVRKARDTGRICVDANGLIDFEQADADWEANTDHSQRRNLKRSAGPDSAEEGVAAKVDDSDPARFPDDGSILEAQRQEKWERVRALRIERLRREGELLERTEFVRLVGELIVTAKTNLRGVGAKIAQDVAAESSPANCQSMIDAEVDEALEKVSQWAPPV